MKKKLISFGILVSILCCMFFASCKREPVMQKFSKHYFDYFDTATTIIGYAPSQEEFDGVLRKIEAELESYHKLYNIYDSFDSINNLKTINDQKNSQPVKVDRKIIDLIKFAKEVNTLTGGKTNIALGSVLSIWHAHRVNGMNNPQNASLPKMPLLEMADSHTNIQDVIIDEQSLTVTLKDKNMSLDVGALAKGYAAERIAETLKSELVGGYMLNLGGNIVCSGIRPDGEGWSIGIENPDREDSERAHIEYVKLYDGDCLVTSGSYQRFYTVNGKNYHHIINPDTLMPSENFSSVSVICKDSGLADALSTALFCMSYEEGERLVESLDGVEALWVDNSGKLYYSKGFSAYTFDYIPQ